MTTFAAPAFEITEITDWSGRSVREVRSCLHANVVAVESTVTGDVVAHLCVDCDRQFA